jgi:hypothetical protein
MIKLTFAQRQELQNILNLAYDEDALSREISRLIRDRDEAEAECEIRKVD